MRVLRLQFRHALPEVDTVQRLSAALPSPAHSRGDYGKDPLRILEMAIEFVLDSGCLREIKRALHHFSVGLESSTVSLDRLCEYTCRKWQVVQEACAASTQIASYIPMAPKFRLLGFVSYMP